MINKRLLIKNLLAHNSENSFYDKKRQINISEKEGKAKFLKHVCALANSNLKNNSYMVIGVEDEDNFIAGVDFFDDSKIQNLINAYLQNPPLVSYENIPFPHLSGDLVVGLVSIRPNNGEICSLLKKIGKYTAGTIFIRKGSISIPVETKMNSKVENPSIVSAIEAHSRNNIELTLDGVFDFFKHHQDINPVYNVFKEYFVVCWSGKKRKVKDQLYYSRVDIALINEQVKLFYSELDEVSITITKDYFKIVEYVHLGFKDQFRYYPLEEVTINFRDNGTYEMESKLLFEPPQFDKKNLHHIFNSNNALVEKLKKEVSLTAQEEKELQNLPSTYLICYFNGMETAIEKLEQAKLPLKNHSETLYQFYKESSRILRKVKYN